MTDFRTTDQKRRDEQEAARASSQVQADYKSEFQRVSQINADLRDEFDTIKTDFSKLSLQVQTLSQSVLDYQDAMAKRAHEIQTSADSMAGLLEQMVVKNREAMEATQRNIAERIDKAETGVNIRGGSGASIEGK